MTYVPTYAKILNNPPSGNLEVLDNPQNGDFRGKARVWLLEKVYNNAEDALKDLEDSWGIQYPHFTNSGKKVYYYCKHSKPACKASIHLLYHADSEKVSRFKTEVEHNHNETQENEREREGFQKR